MLRLFLNGTIFWSADESEVTADHAIFALKTSEEVNTIGTMTFTIGSTHPRKSQLKIRRSTFLLTDDDNILFFGRLTDLVQNFNFMIDCTVSDIMEVFTCFNCKPEYWSSEYDSDLLDSYSDETVSEPLERFVDRNVLGFFNNRNAIWFTSDWAYLPNLQKGYMADPTDSYGNVIQDYTEFGYNRMSSVYDVLFDSYLANSNAVIIIGYKNGRYSSGRYVDFQLYFNVVNDLMKLRLPTRFYGYGNFRDAFAFGDNLIEFTRENNNEDRISGIFPYMTHTLLDSTYQLGITNSNQYGAYIIRSDSLYEKYGARIITIDFGHDDSLSQSDLEAKARNYFDVKYQAFNADKYSIKAIDHYFLNYQITTGEYDSSNWDIEPSQDDGEVIVAPQVDPEVSEYASFELDSGYIVGRDPGVNSPIMLADPVRLFSSYHSVDVTLPCLSKEIDYFNHQNDTYIIGPYIPDNDLDPKLASTSVIAHDGPGKGGGGQRK